MKDSRLLDSFGQSAIFVLFCGVLVVVLVTVSGDSLQPQCLCGFSYNDIITTTYTLTLACVLVRLCVLVCVIGSLPALTWPPVAPSWQGLAGWLARWDGVLDTVDIFGGGGVG